MVKYYIFLQSTSKIFSTKIFGKRTQDKRLINLALRNLQELLEKYHQKAMYNQDEKGRYPLLNELLRIIIMHNSSSRGFKIHEDVQT